MSLGWNLGEIPEILGIFGVPESILSEIWEFWVEFGRFWAEFWIFWAEFVNFEEFGVPDLDFGWNLGEIHEILGEILGIFGVPGVILMEF